MPELPEVETIVRDMNDEISGAQIKNIDFKTLSVWRGKIPTRKSSAGVKIIEFQRLGKHILIHLSNRHTLIIHLKMTGRLTLHKSGLKPSKHTHLIIEFDERELHYNDIRRFGFIDYLKTSEIMNAEYIARLGPDALAISKDEFIKAVKSKNRPIKAALLDQAVISGIGNIYSDEALFQARIRPSRRASNISKTRLTTLGRNIKIVLKKAIDARGSSVSDFVDGSGRRGTYQNHHKVYGRAGESCFSCGTEIKRRIIAARSSHYCPRCQR
jgi:formamidopyrimidine-DNA glycosylase